MKGVIAVTWPLIDENTYRVLDSFRPFLGPRGNGIVEVLTCLNEMLKSEHGQKMRDYLRSFTVGEEFKTLEVQSSDAGSASPFSLFLTLALLKLADAPVFEGKPHARSLQPVETEYQYP